MNDEHPNVTIVYVNNILLMVMMTTGALYVWVPRTANYPQTTTTVTWLMSDIAAGEEHSGFGGTRTNVDDGCGMARIRTKSRAASMGMFCCWFGWTKTNIRLMCSLKLVSIVLWFGGLRNLL